MHVFGDGVTASGYARLTGGGDPQVCHHDPEQAICNLAFTLSVTQTQTPLLFRFLLWTFIVKRQSQLPAQSRCCLRGVLSLKLPEGPDEVGLELWGSHTTR